ncbi:hypothetical protein V2J09_006674 [Rumex salicifolius]
MAARISASQFSVRLGCLKLQSASLLSVKLGSLKLQFLLHHFRLSFDASKEKLRSQFKALLGAFASTAVEGEAIELDKGCRLESQRPLPLLKY